MPVTIPPGAAVLSVVHSGPSTTGSLPTWTIGVTGTFDETSIGDFLLWLGDDYKNNMNALYTIIAFKLTQAAGSNVIPMDVPGARTGEPMPPQVATLVRKSTAEVGRTNMGRMYWPGMLNVGDLGDAATINTSRYSTLTTLTTSMNDMFTSSGLTPVILHSGSSDPTAIGGLNVERQCATQRRRMRQ